MAETYWYLKGAPVFERLSDAQLGKLERRSRARKFKSGSPIYLPADQADAVLLLVSGRVKICNLTPEGKQAILAFVEPGELFGELSIFDPGERQDYAEAIELSTVVLIPRDAVWDMMEQSPELSLGITRLIGLRRRRIERRLKYLLFRSNRERLVHLLLELAEQYGKRTPEGLLLGLKLSHQDLASVIGSTRESVTLLLGELQTQGYLKSGRRKIVLVDLPGLAASVEAEPPTLVKT